LLAKVWGVSFTIVLLYIDDMIITWNNNTIKELKKFLHNKFWIKELSHLKYFKIKIAYSKQGIAISHVNTLWIYLTMHVWLGQNQLNFW
jgi:hypothetical protein